MSDDELPDEPVIDDEPTGAIVYPNPFANEQALAARNIGIERAKLDAEARRAEILASIAINAELTMAYDEAYPENTQKLSRLFKAAAARLASEVLTGKKDIPGGAVGPTITALVNAGRLEAGEHTNATREITTAEQAERLTELRDEANRQLAAAEAAREAGKIRPMTGA